jgi:hypothetical protein
MSAVQLLVVFPLAPPHRARVWATLGCAASFRPRRPDDELDLGHGKPGRRDRRPECVEAKTVITELRVVAAVVVSSSEGMMNSMRVSPVKANNMASRTRVG